MVYPLILLLLIIAILMALKAPVGHPDNPSAEELAERQRQIDRANNTEIL